MAEAKLFRVLKTFTKEEFKEFEKLIVSPFFNTGRDLLPLYRYLKKYHPDYDSIESVKGLKPEVIFKHLFSRQKWDGKKSMNTIDKLFSDTLKSAEEYLFQIGMRDWFSEDKYAFLSLALDEKHLTKETLEAADKSDKLWEKCGINSDFFRGKIFNENSRLSAYLKIDQQIKVPENVFTVSDYIASYFFSIMAIGLRNMIANNRIFNIDFRQVKAYKVVQTLDIDKIINIYKEKNEKYSEITMMYLYNLKALLINKSDKPYFEFKRLFYKNFDILSPGEKSNMFISLSGCAVQRLEKSYNKFTKELLEINKFRLFKKAYKQSDAAYFPVILFRRIFHSALNAGEIKWAEDFISEYIIEVAPEHRDNLKNICQASILIAEFKYDKAIDKIKNVRDDFILINYDKRILTLIYFLEMEHYENALSLLDTSQHFLRNNKTVSAEHHVNYKKFFDIFGKLLKMTISGDYENSFELKKYTISNLPVPFSTWILKKLDVKN